MQLSTRPMTQIQMLCLRWWGKRAAWTKARYLPILHAVFRPTESRDIIYMTRSESGQFLPENIIKLVKSLQTIVLPQLLRVKWYLTCIRIQTTPLVRWSSNLMQPMPTSWTLLKWRVQMKNDSEMISLIIALYTMFKQRKIGKSPWLTHPCIVSLCDG